MRETKTEDRKPANMFRRVFLTLLILIILVMAALLYDSNTRIVATEYELFYPNLPHAFDGYRITVLSDIHAAEFGRDNQRLLRIVEAMRPDIIVISGDIIDHNKKPPLERQLEIAESLVVNLLPIAPVYYVTGNHEWDSGGIRPLLLMLGERGVYILRNSYTLQEAGGEVIILAGTDDPNGAADMIKPPEFVESVFAEAGHAFFVMLEHRNHNLELYSRLGVDLILCGHAHGGIIRLPFTDGLIGPQRDFLPTHTNGVYTMDGTNIVVSRGIGNHTGFPRFLNNPQVVTVTLKVES